MTAHDLRLEKAFPSVDIGFQCYINEIPASFETEAGQLFEKICLNRPDLKRIEEINTYIVRQDDQVLSMFLFELKSNRAIVLNQMIDIEGAAIERFAHQIFSKFDFIDIISFKKIQIGIKKPDLSFPFQKYNSAETFVIALPKTVRDYTERLGKSTRTNVNYYRNKLRRYFPTFDCRRYVDEQIEEQHIRDIIKLKDARFRAQKIFHPYHEEEIKRLIGLAKAGGLVMVASIDGRLCAGTITLRTESDYVGRVIAHDCAYDSYGIGILSAYLTICEAIKLGASRFDLGERRFKYKAGFLGVQQDLDNLEIYRSSRHLVLNFGHAMTTMAASYQRKLKLWLQQHDKNFVTRSAVRTLYFLRSRGHKS